jgi:hypothetical protein
MIFPPAESAFLKAELNVVFFESVSHTSPDIVGDCAQRHMSCRQRGFSPVVFPPPFPPTPEFVIGAV